MCLQINVSGYLNSVCTSQSNPFRWYLINNFSSLIFQFTAVLKKAQLKDNVK